MRTPAFMGSHRRAKKTSGRLVALLAAAAAVVVAAQGIAMADDLESVHYDPDGNELVVTVVYDGTNPDHHFSFKWGTCRRHDRPEHNLINVDVLDDQWGDAANKRYSRTIRVPLAALASCRPATVTLWTPPVSSQSIDVP